MARPKKSDGNSGRSFNPPTKVPMPVPTQRPAPAQRIEPVRQSAVRENIEDEIRQRAYELYEERGRQEGFHEEDWKRVEQEVLARRGIWKTA